MCPGEMMCEKPHSASEVAVNASSQRQEPHYKTNNCLFSYDKIVKNINGSAITARN
jgi:hypothetical protein